MLTPEAVRRIGCDAGVVPVVMTGDGVPLDVGRQQRTVPPALRRALVARDGGCVYPGCGAPAAFCEAHHLRHWADGGPTSLCNLCLLCSFHHHRLHDGEFSIDLASGRPRIIRLRSRAPAGATGRHPPPEAA